MRQSLLHLEVGGEEEAMQLRPLRHHLRIQPHHLELRVIVNKGWIPALVLFIGIHFDIVSMATFLHLILQVCFLFTRVLVGDGNFLE